ncbi:MAG: hypothetical protein PHW32_01150 [Bacilli bacterium]|nr:hypothetical protein [Bacilli bacterium]MDD4282906.1 hypothetical protein [Bacilli bacterium]MDD4719102.1 hypothetical protein [Bacilli bacterium]
MVEVMEIKKGKRSINFKKQIEQFIMGYETEPAKGLVHGFQKDVIQNGWGHRLNDKGKGWSLEISYLENDKGKFIIVEDHGCTGLIGKNYSLSELDEMMINNIDLGSKEKLARFSSLYNSGHNVTSAGLFGRGKQIYQAASERLKYFYDSFTEDGKYVANYIDGQQNMFEKSHEGNQAKTFIFKETGLSEKITHGTRIIIVDPKREIIDSIRNGELIKHINETWWRIIYKYSAKIDIKFMNKIIGTAEVPDFYIKYLDDKSKHKEYVNNDVAPGYRIKRLSIFLVEKDEEIPEGLENIAYYRNDMKIGNVMHHYEFSTLDEKYRDRICGFIEFEKDWEKELENNENLEHYGPKSRREKSYQYMKKYLLNQIEEFAYATGLKKKEERKDADRKLQEMVDDLTNFLLDNDIKMDWDGSIGKKNVKPFQVDLEKYYPNSDRCVEFGEEMKFNINVTTKYNFVADIRIIIIGAEKQERLYKSFENIEVKNERIYSSEIISIDYNEFYPNERNVVKVEVTDKERNLLDSSTFPVFVGVDDEITSEDFELKIINLEFPNQDNRMVRYGEAIKNIKLRIVNNMNLQFKASLAVFVQDVNDRNATILEFYRDNDITLSAHDYFDVSMGDLKFDEKFLKRKGLMRLKVRLSHMSGIEGLKKGDYLKDIGIQFLYEKDQDDNRINLFKAEYEGNHNHYIKSRLLKTPEGGYNLIINMNYIEYKFVADEEKSVYSQSYFAQEMIKAIIKIKLEMGDYSIFELPKEIIEVMSPSEMMLKVNEITDKLVAKYLEVRI